MTEWIKFSDEKPPSFKDIVYEYKVFSNLDKINSETHRSIGWVDSAPEEELSIFDIRKFSIYPDDEDYELVAWYLVPDRICPDCKADLSEVDGHCNVRLGKS